MALVTLPSHLVYPDALGWGSSSNAMQTVKMDAVDEWIGWMLPITKTGNVRKIGINITTVTVALALKVQLVSLDTGGLPSNSLWAANTQSVITVPAAGWQWLTLTADGAVTAGLHYVGVRIDWNVAFVPGSDIDFAYTVALSQQRGNAFATSTLSAPATRSGQVPVVALEYSDGSRPPCFALPLAATPTQVAFNSGSTPDEVGTRFKTPFGGTCIGAMVRLAAGTATTYDVLLYNNADTVIASALDVDSDHRAATSPQFTPFSASVLLAQNTIYRLVIRPDAATNITRVEYTVDSNGTLEAHPGGIEVYKTARTTNGGAPGAWTDTTTSRVLIFPVFSAIDSEA